MTCILLALFLVCCVRFPRRCMSSRPQSLRPERASARRVRGPSRSLVTGHLGVSSAVTSSTWGRPPLLHGPWGCTLPLRQRPGYRGVGTRGLRVCGVALHGLRELPSAWHRDGPPLRSVRGGVGRGAEALGPRGPAGRACSPLPPAKAPVTARGEASPEPAGPRAGPGAANRDEGASRLASRGSGSLVPDSSSQPVPQPRGGGFQSQLFSE